jgi:hypothetical protein
MFIAVAALAVAALSAFVAYNYLYVSIEYPDNFIFVGKTINTSELYQTDKFSWYTYDVIKYWENQNDPPTRRMTIEYGNGTYDGIPCLRETHTYRVINDTLNWPIQTNHWYFDSDGKWIADEFQAYESGVFRNNGTHNDRNYTYQKRVFLLPYGLPIAPRGTETITLGNKTYDCRKYYLPDHNIDGVGQGYRITYWFADGIPVPVKVQPARENAVFELVDWG